MKEEMIKEFYAKRNKFAEFIKEKFDLFYNGNRNDLSTALEFTNYTTQLINYLNQQIEFNQVASKSRRDEESNILRIERTFRIDSLTNKEKADKWLVNALILHTRGFVFDGVTFTKGSQTMLKNNILRK